MSESDETPADQSGASAENQSLRELLRRNRLSSDPAGATAFLLSFGVLSALMCALSGWVLAAACLLIVVLAIMMWRLFPLPALSNARASLGNDTPARLLLGVTVGVLALQQSGTVSVLAWLTIASYGLLVLAESPLRVLHTRTTGGAANLPGAPPERSAAIPVALIQPTTLIATASALASATIGFSWIPALVLVLAAAAVGVSDLAAQLIALRNRKRDRKKLIAAVTDYQPVFALYWKADPGTAFQIAMWLPYLERLGKPFVIVVRTQPNADDAVALTDRPVLLCRDMSDLDDIVVPSLKTVFYVNNANQNTHMVRIPGLKHIMLNHGDSDKAPSYNPVSRMYDRNFVAGQAAIDRFSDHGIDVPPSQLVIVGRPQIEEVEIATTPIAHIDRPRVLYAPTWAGFTAEARYSSLPVGADIIKELLSRGCDVVFRPHPWARRTLQLDAACTEIIGQLKSDPRPGANHVYGDLAEKKWGIVECFNNCDAMIADVSGVVADFLYSGKPLAMVATRDPEEKFIEEFPLARAAYLIDAHEGTAVGMDQALDGLLGEDPLRDTRLSMKRHYLSESPTDHYSDLFLQEAAAYL